MNINDPWSHGDWLLKIHLELLILSAGGKTKCLRKQYLVNFHCHFVKPFCETFPPGRLSEQVGNESSGLGIFSAPFNAQKSTQCNV